MKFYVLENNQFVGPLAFGEMVEPVTFGDSGPRCPCCGKFLKERPWESPHRVRFRPGTQSRSPGDIVFGDFSDFISSKRFITNWQDAGLSGIEEWYPVTIVGESYEFFLPRFSDPTVQADFEATGIDWKREPDCRFCGSGVMNSIKGLSVSEDTWDGQDLFHLTNISGLLIGSERFSEMVVSSGITNVNLILAGEYEENLLE